MLKMSLFRIPLFHGTSTCLMQIKYTCTSHPLKFSLKKNNFLFCGTFAKLLWKYQESRWTWRQAINHFSGLDFVFSFFLVEVCTWHRHVVEDGRTADNLFPAQCNHTVSHSTNTSRTRTYMSFTKFISPLQTPSSRYRVFQKSTHISEGTVQWAGAGGVWGGPQSHINYRTNDAVTQRQIILARLFYHFVHSLQCTAQFQSQTHKDARLEMLVLIASFRFTSYTRAYFYAFFDWYILCLSVWWPKLLLCVDVLLKEKTVILVNLPHRRTGRIPKHQTNVHPIQ